MTYNSPDFFTDLIVFPKSKPADEQMHMTGRYSGIAFDFLEKIKISCFYMNSYLLLNRNVVVLAGVIIFRDISL